MEHRQRLAAALLSICVMPVTAQTSGVVLEPIVITAQRSDTDWLETPAAVGIVDLQRIQQGAPNLAIDEALRRLPGIYIQNRYNFAQGERLSIRGFGTRANFGIRGIRVLVDGLPLTLPDGQTELGGLDLGLVERAELIRGPSSALYGNAAGGVLLLSTGAPPPEPTAEVTATAGEFDFGSLRLEAGGRRGDLGALASAKHTTFGGFRDHSDFDETAFYGKLVRDTHNGSSTLILNVSETESDDPGGLTAGELRTNRRQAAGNNQRFNAGEEITQSRLGWLLRRELGAGQTLDLRLFGGYREFSNRLPFENGGQVAFERAHAGFGLQYTLASTLLGQPNRFIVGLDAELQRDDRRRYDNLESGVRGAKTLDQLEKVDGLGLYAANTWQPAKRWTLMVGLRGDYVRLAVDDDFITATDLDDSVARDYDELSGSIAVGYALAPRHRLYANIGTGFETPTTAELANPEGGGFNPELEAMRARNLELGVKGETERLRYDVALFEVRVEDDFVSFERPGEPGRSFFRNTDTRRQGVELGLDWRLRPEWSIGVGYTYNRARFDGGGNLPGIPRQHLFLELAHDAPRRFAALQLVAVDSIAADDANTVTVPGYGLVNARAGIRRPFGALQAELFAGINNLLDRDHIDNVRINAGGGRYYEPGPGRHVYAGATLRY